MSKHSQNSLAKFRPYFTWGLIILSLTFYFLISAFDNSLYGVETDPIALFSFTSTLPFKNSLLPLLSSAFLHANVKHLVINMMFLGIFSYLLELKLGWKVLLLYFFILHLCTLALLALLSSMNFLAPYNFFGLSHVAFGFISLWFKLNKKRFLLLSLMTYFIVSYYQSGLEPGLISHAIGALMGFILGYSLAEDSASSSKRSLR